ncbi:glycosyltransferase family 2 protein [Microvirga sp. BSC39]|uniref:glycosyltransferase family 2 protein n=1 Tax=Microvirga sp. BSC39 TaxID=1549810 RepID=UPI00068CB147|nr:glycosyltransferase family 2 protein [Microvirga sp. BSC39]
MIEVSVIVPVRNGHDFIRRSVESALRQTLREIEVIVVDDASTDDTAQIVEEHAEKEPRLKIIRLDTNRGPSAARNAGIAAASGRWIALLDADDWYVPERLKLLTAAGDQAGADLVCDDLLLFDEASKSVLGPMFGLNGLPSRIDGECFVLGNLPNPKMPRRGYGFLKPIVRRSYIDLHDLRYNEDMRFAEDYAFYVNALLEGATWISVPSPNYVYSVREGSLTLAHRAADLLKLCSVDEAALVRAQGHPRFQNALRRHFITTQQRAAWVQFIDFFKERRITDLIRTATMSAPVLRYIAWQCLIQAVVRSSRRIGLQSIN